MAVSIVIDITQNSQSISNNTSNVTVKVNAKWTYGSYNLLDKLGSCTIDGTKYTFEAPFNTGKTTSGSCNLYTKKLNITHASDGTKTLKVSASYTSGVKSGTVAASASKALTTIPRKSTLSVANGTLGTSQTLTVTRQSTSFTHTITYTCGSASGTICTKSTSASIPFTPPLSLASQNTTGESVSIQYTITTYNGSTSVGSTRYTKTCSIPASVKPSCSVAVSDPTGYADRFGGYIKGVSKFKVVVTPTTAQGSPIASYSTTANGATYAAASFTTGVLKYSGTLTVSTTVKDKRGRSGLASTSLTVLNYTQPVVDKLTVKRCNSDGTENDKGEHVLVTFSATVTSLNSKNTAEYTLRYKKSTEAETAFSKVPMTDYNNVYSVSDATFIFPADSGSSYYVELLVSDAFYSGNNAIKRATSASTAFTLLHFGADGTSLAIGKIAELKDHADFNYTIYPRKGFKNIPIEENRDLDSLIKPNTYVSQNKATYEHCPVSSGTFKMDVSHGGMEGQIHQTLTYTNKTDFKIYHRQYHSGSWGDWKCVYSVAGNVLWRGNYYMTADHVAPLSEPISLQPHGIVLVFARYNTGEDPYAWSSFFVPKQAVSGDTYNGSGHTFIMATNCFAAISTKYLYIRDDQIKGNANNNSTGTANGITYNNAAFTLRYVIGV